MSFSETCMDGYNYKKSYNSGKIKNLIRRFYHILPFKKQLYLILKRIYTPGQHIYQYLYFVDNMTVRIDGNRQFKIRHYGFRLENEIFWKGIYNGWEQVSQRIWFELCQEAQTIFDIGANTGLYSLMAKTINPNADVYAFEPVERVYDKLSYNNLLNNYDIKCEKKAISNRDGSALIYDQDTEHTYSITVNKDTTTDGEKAIPIRIETVRLDTFIQQNNISRIDLLKIDVETHEVEVLEGLGKYIKAFEPTLLIEILDEDIAKGVSELLAGIDYMFFNIDENSGIRKVSRLSKSDYYNFLICKPEIAERLEILKRFTASKASL